jgi:hypothetical protein
MNINFPLETKPQDAEAIKKLSDIATSLEELIGEHGRDYYSNAQAKIKLEECVMWTIQAILAS